MEIMSNVSSEEELLQLRHQGKISEAEYEELRSAMSKSAKLNVEPRTAATDRERSKRRLGQVAFALMLTGIILPAFFYFMIELLSGPNTRPAIGPFFFLGVAFEIAAFVLGVISWPDVFGKAAALTTSVLFVLIVVLAILTI